MYCIENVSGVGLPCLYSYSARLQQIYHYCETCYEVIICIGFSCENLPCNGMLCIHRKMSLVMRSRFCMIISIVEDWNKMFGFVRTHLVNVFFIQTNIQVDSNGKILGNYPRCFCRHQRWGLFVQVTEFQNTVVHCMH